jgi:RNA polymerase sigma factor (sigma-70 family)
MSNATPPEAGDGPWPPDAESTFQLLDRARSGDDSAIETLFARYLKPLRRWASGRLPQWARNSADTHDLVQDTLLSAFRRIESFEPRREGAFQAYLRQAVMNRIRDQIRRTGTRPAMTTLNEEQHENDASPYQDLVTLETFERYEAALARLKPEEREAVIGRVELEQSYEELAKSLDRPTPDAARMAVARALVRLAEEMRLERRR